MALVKHYKILESQLSSLPVSEGQIIYTTDTKKIFLDINNSTREEILRDDIVTDTDLNTKNKFVLSETEPEGLLAGDIWGVLE